MSEFKQPGPTPEAVEDVLRQELAHGDVILATAGPVLRHLLAHGDQSFFSDEVVATIRGMMLGLAREMLFALAKQAGVGDRAAFADEMQDDIALALLEDADFLGHAHAITIEAQTADRLSRRSGIDAVLSPLLQELVASSDQAIASDAMRALSAQARFMQQRRRMELPLNELPQPLFERALEQFIAFTTAHEDHARATELKLRAAYDPEKRRVGQLVGLISSMQHKAKRALEVDNAGLSLFVTALSMASDQGRDTVILSLGESHCARLALSLRAAGLGQGAVEEQFLYLHPEITLPDGFETIRGDRAASVLANAQTVKAG